MVTNKTSVHSDRIRIVAGFDQITPYFKKAFAANIGVNLTILAMVLYSFGMNFYSLLYLVCVLLSVLATIPVLAGFDRYSFIRVIIILPTLLMTHNIIIIVGSASSYFGAEFSICVAFSLLYIFFMTIYEILTIKKNSAFLKTAKKGLGKIGTDYYCKPEMSLNLLDLSSIKRNSAWIRAGTIGFLQKITIVLMFLFFLASFLFIDAEDGYLVSDFLFSIGGIILGVMGRPMLVAIGAEQVAVFMLEKEFNSKK
jgi:hypothetical protein